MMRYETLFLAVPEITNDEAASIEKEFDKMVRVSQGGLISFERWGKYRLAYPVAGNEYGVYFLARFECEPGYHQSVLDDIKQFFIISQSTIVKRYVTTRLDSKASLAYQRPESLEDSPRDVDDFLRKNKMEGLLSNQKKSDQSESKVSAAPVAEQAGQEVSSKADEESSKSVASE